MDILFTSKREVGNVGDRPVRGQVIGKKGNVGTSTVHLHFSVKIHLDDERYLANTTDPSPYFNANVNYDTGARAFQRDVTGWCNSGGSKAVMTSPAPGSTLSGSSATFNWTSGTNVNYYYLWVGTSGAGTNNLYSNGSQTGLSATVGNLPSSGTVYIRLWSHFGLDTWEYNDYTYATTTSCSTTQYRAEYYNNRTLSGGPAFIRCEGWPIDHDWGSAGPGSGVGSDNFSVRWTGRASIPSGTYTFSATADDGIRVWIDNVLVIDAWRDQGPTTYQATRSISSGDHDIKVEYYENGGGAVAKFRWDQATGGGSGQVTIEEAWTSDGTGTGNTAKTTFQPGDSIGYVARVNNQTSNGAVIQYHWCAGGDCVFANWSGGFTTGVNTNAGTGNWYGNTTVPSWAGAGTYSFTASVTSGGQTSTKTTTFTVQSGGGGNLALNKSVRATSVESAFYNPIYGVDGRMDTRWSSQISSSLGWQWYMVDLGSPQTFNRIVVQWEAAYAAKYWVAWCDSDCWRDDSQNWYGFQRTRSSPGEDAINVDQMTHRYMALLMVDRAPSMNNFSFWELGLFNTAGTAAGDQIEGTIGLRRSTGVNVRPSAPSAADRRATGPAQAVPTMLTSPSPTPAPGTRAKGPAQAVPTMLTSPSPTPAPATRERQTR